MKDIEIGTYVAEVKAKRLYENRSTAEAAGYLLNEISLVYSYAAKYMKSQGYDYFAEDYKEKGKALYEMLHKLGFYED